MSIIALDIGKSGGIATENKTIKMPTIKIEIKPAIMVLNKKNGKKQFYKSGPKKGNPIYKVKTPAKYSTELDIRSIRDIFNGSSVIIMELPGNSIGNSAKSTATTFFNYGKLHAIAELSGAKVVSIAASKWKKDLDVTKDKEECVDLAEKIRGVSFRTERNALRDGEAEAALIYYWYKKYGVENNE